MKLQYNFFREGLPKGHTVKCYATHNVWQIVDNGNKA